jgi:hypothetical protein
MELLNKIKVPMHDPMIAKHPFASSKEVMVRMLNIKQIENEGLLDCTKRFKQSRDITKSHVGTAMLDKLVEKTHECQDETDALKQQDMKDGTFEKWMACLLIRDSNQGKHGSLVNRLALQFSMENNQHPNVIMSAADMLSNHDMIAGQAKETISKERAGVTPRRRKESSIVSPTRSSCIRMSSLTSKLNSIVQTAVISRQQQFSSSNAAVSTSLICNAHKTMINGVSWGDCLSMSKMTR